MKKCRSLKFLFGILMMIVTISGYSIDGNDFGGDPDGDIWKKGDGHRRPKAPDKKNIRYSYDKNLEILYIEFTNPMGMCEINIASSGEIIKREYIDSSIRHICVYTPLKEGDVIEVITEYGETYLEYYEVI